MIQDIVYSAIPSYSDLSFNYRFNEKDGNTYNFQDMFQLGFDFSLDPINDSFAMGKGSGMIAYCHVIYAIGSSHPVIQLFNAQSKPLQEIRVNSAASQLFLNVLPNDDIVCVTNLGDIFIYSSFKEIKNYSLGNFYSNCLIMKASFYDEGVVCALADGNIINVKNFDKPEIMQHFNDFGKPDAMFVIPPSKSYTENTIVMLCEKGHLYVIDDKRYYEMELPMPVLYVSASYNYSKIAILLKDLTLIVTNQSLDKIIYQTKVNDEEQTNFTMMEWIGDICPAIAMDGAVILGTEDPESPIEFYEKPILFSEIDSVYVLSNGQSYRISYVPDNVAMILSKNKESIGHQLCEIFDKRLEEPFVEKISRIDGIQQAITDLIETAEYISDHKAQIFYVATACFANTYSNRLGGSIIGKVNQKLRIINALYDIGIPTTSKQLDAIGIDNTLLRLCHHGKHNLALKIAEFTKNSNQKIVDDLVSVVIDTTPDDKMVIPQLPTDYIRPSFAADYALKANRPQLAIEFLDLEKNSSHKSMLFARMGQWTKALECAAKTCDSSCLFAVLQMALQSHSNPEAVNQSIALCEAAVHLLMKVPSITSPQRLEEILHAIPQNEPQSDVLRTFNLVQSKYQDTLSNCSSLKQLRNVQEQIINETGDTSIRGLSLYDTLRNLILKDSKKHINLIVKSFKIDSKRLTILQFQTFVSNKRWASLKSFGISKKDLWPQIIMVLKREDSQLALNFIDEIGVSDPKAKAQLLSNFEKGFEPNVLSANKPYCSIFN